MILYSSWLKLPLSVRNDIAAAMGVRKSGSIEVFDGRVIRDGYGIHELEAALSVPAMQTFLNTKEKDMSALFDRLVKVITGEESASTPPGDTASSTEEPVLVVQAEGATILHQDDPAPETPEPAPEAPVKKAKGRPKKNPISE